MAVLTAAAPTWLRPAPPHGTIAGYSLQPSVPPGGVLQLAVSTAAGVSYRVQVYRLGWYGGVGARLVVCRPSCSTAEAGTTQPQAAPDWTRRGEVQEHWRTTDTVRVGGRWTTGYYLAELVVASGRARGDASLVPFVVRPPPRSRATILVDVPVDTWAAYDTYGGTDFYTGPGKRKAHIVSLDRPFGDARLPLQYEYPLVRFLERSGYDVDYTTDVDITRDPAQLLRYRLVLVPGHSEYWTAAMRSAFEQARAAGVNLAFFGGNDLYQEVAYADGGRTIEKVGIWRDLSPRWQECALAGVEWQGGWVGDGVEPGSEPGGPWVAPRPYTVDAAALGDPWFAGTGFTAGSSVPGIVGYEWDAVEPGCRPQPTVLFHYQGVPWRHALPYQYGWVSTNADAVRYTWPSGATVFAAGSIQFSWGLDGFDHRFGALTGAADPVNADPRLQRFVRNMLDQLTAPPPRVPEARSR